MFAGFINQAKSAVTGLVLKYVARASVAIPFVIAVGFALAATTVMLVERFGHVTAYWLVAGGLAAIGVIAAIIVSVKEHKEEVAENQAEKTDTAEVVSDATADAIVQTPVALLGSLFALPGGPGAALKIAKVLGNNYALVLLIVVIGALLWPADKNKSPETRTDDVDIPAPPPANVVAFSQGREMRNGSRGWTAIVIIGVGIALAVASIFLVDPVDAKRAVLAHLGW